MKKLLSLVLVIAMVVCTVPVVFAADLITGLSGSGTADDPVLIASEAQWETFVTALNTKGNEALYGADKHYKLTADLDFADYTWTNKAHVNDFKAHFDGDGHTVSNFTVGGGVCGFFYCIWETALIENLGMVDVTFNGASDVIHGSIIGKIRGGNLRNCFVRGIKESGTNSSTYGGLIGQTFWSSNYPANIQNCYVVSRYGEDGYIGSGSKLRGLLNEGAYGGGNTTEYVNITNSYIDTSVLLPSSISWGNRYHPTVTDSYYVADNVAASASTLGTSKTAAELKTNDMAYILGADYYNVDTDGTINGGYPVLKYQGGTEPTAPTLVPGVAGVGTAAEPVLITSVDDFNAVAVASASNTFDGNYFKLMNDIDFQDTALTATIGTSSSYFKGIFDGNGHVISNFKADQTSFDAALFGCIGGNAVVKNLGVEGVTVIITNANYNVAGIVANAYDNAKISGCFARNFKTGTYPASEVNISAGGVVGRLHTEGVVIENCYALNTGLGASIKVNNNGELFGCAVKFSEIRNCYAGDFMGIVYTQQWAKAISCYFATSQSTLYPGWYNPKEGAKDNWADATHGYVGYKVSADDLKTHAYELGEAFNDDSTGTLNGGYPVLDWQGGTEPVAKSLIPGISGMGTEDDPALITSLDDWNLFAEASINDKFDAKYFKLTNDLDFAGVAAPKNIGHFHGLFDGNGHVISNYTISSTNAVDTGNIALFYRLGQPTNDSTVNGVINLGMKDVVLDTASFSGTPYVGTIVGMVNSSNNNSEKVQNCFVSGVKFTGSNSSFYYGGLIGNAHWTHALAENCYSVTKVGQDGYVTAAQLNALTGFGGILGRINPSTSTVNMTNCYTDTNILCKAEVTGTTYNIVNTYYNSEAGLSGTPVGTGKTAQELRQDTVSLLGSAFKYAPNFETNNGFPMLAWEAGAADTNEGIYVAPSFIAGLEGDGTAEAPVLIGSVSDWNTFANAVNADPTKMAAGKYYKLTADIDFEEADYTLFIGTEANPFQATFDGAGHKITNVKILNTLASNMTYGLFGYVAGDAVIKNVGVENIQHYRPAVLDTVWSQSTFGGLIAILAGNAKVEYCYSKNVTVDTKRTDNIPYWSAAWASFTGDQISEAGGLIGKTVSGNCVVENCYGLGFADLSDCASTDGAIVGYVVSVGKIAYCYSDTHNGCIKLNNGNEEKISNTYYPTWIWYENTSQQLGSRVSADLIKAMAGKELGGGFAYDKNNVNGGYPVFAAVRGFDVVTNVVKSGNTITSIDVVKNSGVDGKVIVAAYDSNGLLIATKVADVSAAGGTVNIGLDATGATVVKAYFLKADGEATPTSSINIL